MRQNYNIKQPSYSKEEKAQAHEVSTLSFLQERYDLNFKKAGAGWSCIEHDSLYINADETSWYWNSRGFGGGDTIEFIRKYENKSYPEALETILGHGGNVTLPVTKKAQRHSLEAKELILPLVTEGKYARVFAYLNKTRCIDASIISELMHQKLLYEDIRHNAVFVGLNHETQKPAFACLRSTATDVKFRGDCKGSDKATGFYLKGQNNSLLIFESPIDALSHATIVNKFYKDPTAYKQNHYLAGSGVNLTKSIDNYLQHNPSVKKIFICLDNDTAGKEAAPALQQIYKTKGYQVEIKLPHEKDYNEQLIKFMKRDTAQVCIPPPMRRI